MLRFNHELNTWEVQLGTGKWYKITPQSARQCYDQGADVEGCERNEECHRYC